MKKIIKDKKVSPEKRFKDIYYEPELDSMKPTEVNIVELLKTINKNLIELLKH